MNPYKRVEGFNPAYVDAATVDWIAGLDPEGVLQLARVVAHTHDIRSLVKREAEITGAGLGGSKARIEFRTDDLDRPLLTETTLHNVLMDWLSYSRQDDWDEKPRVLAELAERMEASRKTLAQLALIISDVWEVDVASRRIYQAVGTSRSFFPNGPRPPKTS